jgi:hypothetical protein
MLVQRTFKREYVEELAAAVKSGQGLERYAAETFDYDSDQVVIIPTLRHPEGLIDKMIPVASADCDSAIALYEAYPSLTPLQASDRAFWTYLTHVDLFQYVQARFPKVKEPDFDSIPYVYDHWFCGDDWTWRHPLASLWWFVYQTIDEDSDDKYKYTRFFFTSFGFRTNFAKYSIARCKEAVFGYFQFLMDNPDITASYLKPRNRFITKYLNKLGGSRLLSSLPREAFYNELKRIKPQILAITSYSLNDEVDDEETEE